MPKWQQKRKLMMDDIKPSSNCRFAQRHRCPKRRTRECRERLLFYFRSDEEDQMTEVSSSDSWGYSPHSLHESKAPVARCKRPSTYQRPTTVATDVQPKRNHQTTVKKAQQDPCDTSSKMPSNCITTVECQSDVTIDRVTRDELVKKCSACLSFYGNFVIIPAVRKTLDKIQSIDHNIKLSYWHEVMVFIDSYDLPYADEQRRKLVDELVEKITEYVENEGISAEDWQKIICTLPDDASNKFDYRLENYIIDEMENLGKEDQLPFDLINYIEGDMVFPTSLLTSIGRGVLRRGTPVAWPNGIVPY
ncbi:unnamed protein product [Rotaria sordida]|uniref:Uncharacterized protein n=1 Tax=Rotaria sordida TaxID=392033 RepID=A0A819PL47_9BILA|nr:unnamed protein product [Rotaria sordida]CAF4019046.1 unnamed protein product [Rotaria sordida]